MRIVGGLFIVILMSLSVSTLKAAEEENFGGKLKDMRTRVDRSIELIRTQIADNQNAPFIADLYLQLGELLAQKSNVLYYIGRERDVKKKIVPRGDKKYHAVVEVQKEAIRVYRKIIREFPRFKKRAKVYYLLTVSLKSIDEIPAFLAIAEKSVKLFPKTQQSYRILLLMGEHYFDQKDFKEAKRILSPVVKAKFSYERDLAKYKLGLIAMSEGKYRSALSLFEAVIVDEDLKEEDNPFAVSLEKKTTKTNLKREALLDSIRAYTHVYKKNPRPERYYSKISPTEMMFQEVIQKLAFRYIYLKKYNYAVKMLRTLSERTADPQKVVNIYQEVLMMIPLKERINIPVSEMRFLLQKFNRWLNFYEMDRRVLKESYRFFEKQVRDLATRSHDLAKGTSGVKRLKLLRQGRDYYLLYIGFFKNSREKVKMSMNLADIYFRQKEYLLSGDYYLRCFNGEFGPPIAKAKLIRNAISSLQRKIKSSFYGELRQRGLLIRAIKSYMSFDPKKAQEPTLNFVLVKMQYEQGLYETALQALYKYMKRFPRNRRVRDAGHLILDYFNTRQDFAGIVTWSKKILELRLPHKKFNREIDNIRKQALLNKVRSRVKTQTNYDEFSEGKSYLQAALNMEDDGLKVVALKEALARSKSEKDYNTFFKSALVIAKKEKNSSVRGKIQASVIDINIVIGRYVEALALLKKSAVHGVVSVRQSAFDRAVSLSGMLRDYNGLARLSTQGLWKSADPTIKFQISGQVAELMELPIKVNPQLIKMAMASPNGQHLLSIYKGQFKVSNPLRRQILSRVGQYCQDGRNESVCSWQLFTKTDSEIRLIRKKLKKASVKIAAVEGVASQVMGGVETLGRLMGQDPTLDVLIYTRQRALFGGFARYLMRVAKRNPDFKTVLKQKAKDAAKQSRILKKKCVLLVKSANVRASARKICGKKLPRLQRALGWGKLSPLKTVGKDPVSPQIKGLRQEIFAAQSEVKFQLDLAYQYYVQGHHSHAMVAATYGMSKFSYSKGDFQSILGCSLLKTGYFNEAKFHLNEASSYQGLKKSCQGELKKKIGRY